jgi:hypothetical protein
LECSRFLELHSFDEASEATEAILAELLTR